VERLQKLLAQAGIASRRHAEEMILAGRVRVNGKVITELGAQADPAMDTVVVDNHPIAVESQVYYVLNKPRGYISDRDDTAPNKTALDLVPDGRRLFAAGRLDLMSEGLLFITNDGELANRLTHPRYEHEKEYLALVFGAPDDKVIERLERGILFDGEWMRADSAARAGRSQEFGEAGRDETWLRIILHEGKKRQIRHMCASLGHPVKRLIRIRIGPLRLGTLKLGEWRKLTKDEIALMKQTQERSKQGGRTRGATEGVTAERKPRISTKGWAKNKVKPNARPAKKPYGKRDDKKRTGEGVEPQAERPVSRPPRPRPGWAESGGRAIGRSPKKTTGGRAEARGRQERGGAEGGRPANKTATGKQGWVKIGGRDNAKGRGDAGSAPERPAFKTGGGRSVRNKSNFAQDSGAPQDERREPRGGRAPFKTNTFRGKSAPQDKRGGPKSNFKGRKP
jgi:23S rRNA pseudouridine2605 synthase